MAGRQRLGQLSAEDIRRKAGQQPGLGPQPTKRDGSVEDRAAGMGDEGILARRRRGGEHVDQRFAAT